MAWKNGGMRPPHDGVMEKETVFVQGDFLCVEAVACENADDILPFRNCYAVMRLKGTESEDEIGRDAEAMEAIIARVGRHEITARKAMEKSCIRNLLVYDECSDESCFEHQDRVLRIYREHRHQIPLSDGIY